MDDSGNRNNLLIIKSLAQEEYVDKDERPLVQSETQADSSSRDTALKNVDAGVIPTQQAGSADENNQQADSGTFKVCLTENTPNSTPSELQNSSDSGNNVLNKDLKSDRLQEDDTDVESYRRRIEGFKLFLTVPDNPGMSRAIKDETIPEEEMEDAASLFSPSGTERNNSNAPLFAHECLHHEDAEETLSFTSSEKDQTFRRRSDESVCSQDSFHEPITPEILKDPHLEKFPSGAEQVLRRMATLHEELPPDDCTSTDLDNNNPHEVTDFGKQSTPTFSHELPPIGSPTAARLRNFSISSPVDIPTEAGTLSPPRPLPPPSQPYIYHPRSPNTIALTKPDVPNLSYEYLAPLYAHILSSSNQDAAGGRHESMRRSFTEAKRLLFPANIDEREPLVRSTAVTAEYATFLSSTPSLLTFRDGGGGGGGDGGGGSGPRLRNASGNTSSGTVDSRAAVSDGEEESNDDVTVRPRTGELGRGLGLGLGLKGVLKTVWDWVVVFWRWAAGAGVGAGVGAGAGS